MRYEPSDITIPKAINMAVILNSNDADGVVLKLLQHIPSVAPTPFGTKIQQGCARSGSIDSIKFLVHSGAQVNATFADEMPALFQAVATNQMQGARLLLDIGVRLDQIQKYGSEALCGAAEVNNIEGTKMLMDAGAQASCCMSNSNFPLLLAAKDGRGDMVSFLIPPLEGLNSKDNTGQTVLMAASRMDHIAVVRLLLDNGALVEAQDRECRTALHHAALERNKAVMSEITKKMAATVTQTGTVMWDKYGKSAWDYVKAWMNRSEQGPLKK